MSSKIRVFRHPLFGKIKVERVGNWLYFPARSCAKKLLFLRVNRALISAKAVCEYSLVRGRVTGKTMLGVYDVWKLLFYCKGTWREGLAKEFYSWVYDEICPAMLGERMKGY